MTQPEPTPSTSQPNLGETIAHIAGFLSHLSTGELAMLRRGPLRKGEAGAPAFWRLSLHDKHNFAANETWAAIIQAMALLTKRNESGDGHRSPHNTNYPLGKALCDGGDTSWPSDGQSPRPAFSELRLARLLNARSEARRDSLLRAIRILARADTPINCTDIARLLLEKDDQNITRKIARGYYTRLSRAEGKAKEKAES